MILTDCFGNEQGPLHRCPPMPPDRFLKYLEDGEVYRLRHTSIGFTQQHFMSGISTWDVIGETRSNVESRCFIIDAWCRVRRAWFKGDTGGIPSLPEIKEAQNAWENWDYEQEK